MNKQQKIAKKRKDRAKVAKAKVEARREHLREEQKLQQQKLRKEHEARQIVHGKQKPIINDPAEAARREDIRTKNASNKIKKNLEILQALEDEYDKEQALRTAANAQLESEGHKTMREKMDALHQKALLMTNKADILANATREYAAKQNVDNEQEIVIQPLNLIEMENFEKIS